MTAILDSLRTSADCRTRVDGAWTFMEELYPLFRSVTGQGVRQTLAAIGRRIPLEVTETPSGTKVFDWEIPREWNVTEAWIADPAGRRVVDLREHTLHLVSYSTPIHAFMRLDELRPHLHALPAHPDWIPYRTSHYRDAWGFCLRQRTLDSLPDGVYEVRIDSTLEPGHLTYGECVVPGQVEDEFLVFTHVCHPSLCNDNLTGIALATVLAGDLSRTQPHLTYRFVFAPGTIGSIAWLARNEARTERVRHGLVLGLLGDRGPLNYKRSRRSNAAIDRIAAYVLGRDSTPGRLRDFSPYGYDERQLCSPGFDLPVGRLTRSPNDEYPEYHSSADDFSLLDRDSLAQSLLACADILRIADRNSSYVNLNPKCEPQLGKRGLFRPTGGENPGQFEHALLWMLSQSDGSRTLLDIAERSSVPFEVLARAADELEKVQLLRPLEGD
jgi:aminopeptidase-like protein